MQENLNSCFTNSQWAWEFLRRSREYKNAYFSWKDRISDDQMIAIEEQDKILRALERLGPWKSRYSPWVEAGLTSRRPFIKEMRVDRNGYHGRHIVGNLELDPMRFLLKKWIDPGVTPLPVNTDSFDQIGSLNISIVDEHSEEFFAALELGLLDVFLQDAKAPRTPEFKTLGELLPLVFPENGVIQNLELFGWLRPPLDLEEWELSEDAPLVRPNDQDRLKVASFAAPRVMRHRVYFSEDNSNASRVDLNMNLQFDLTQSLGSQLAAATQILRLQQDKVKQLAPYEIYAHDVQKPNVLSTYSRGLELLDAFDQITGYEGGDKLNRAIKMVLLAKGKSDEASMGSKDSMYERLAKAYRSAERLRQFGYRSLAFLKDQ